MLALTILAIGTIPGGVLLWRWWPDPADVTAPVAPILLGLQLCGIGACGAAAAHMMA